MVRIPDGGTEIASRSDAIMTSSPPNTLSSLTGLGIATVVCLTAGDAAGAVIPLDLLTANATAAGPSGSIFKQIGTGAGTGNWDPFLSLDSKKGILSGYNTDASSSAYDPNIVTGGGRTHSVTFGQLRYTTVGGTDYVRFSLDINEPATTPERYLALNDFRIFAPAGSGWANYNGPISSLGTALYDMDTGGNRTVLMNYSLQSGSGVSDMELFVPLSLFGGLSANRSIVVYSRIGDGTGIDPCDYPISDWGANAGGFDEWRLSTTDKPVPVPEASTVVMAFGLCGGLGIIEYRRRHRRVSPLIAW